jgi:acyl carrier protein phosphodiesterase
MNYLAHLFFADDNSHSRIGNLLGDFCHGVDVKSLPAAVQQGLRQHRAIDVFTDQSAEVAAAKQYFAAERRRFAGIAIDMLFDHFLIRHWSKFHPQPFDLYTRQLYQKLATDLPQMPASMQPTVSAIIRQDWFLSYADINQLGRALDRVAQRIRFANRFSGTATDIQAHYPELEQLFLQFFPRLQQYVQQLNGDSAEKPAR